MPCLVPVARYGNWVWNSFQSIMLSSSKLDPLITITSAFSFRTDRKITLNEHLDTLNLAMCTGITFECGQLLTSKLPLWVDEDRWSVEVRFFFSCRLRCLNIAWTNLTTETVRYLCETVSRCMEQLNISGQRYNLTDDRKATRSSVNNNRIIWFLFRCAILSETRPSPTCSGHQWFSADHRSIDRCTSTALPVIVASLGIALLPFDITSTHVMFSFASSSSIHWNALSDKSSTLKLLPAFSTLDIFGTLAAFPLQQLRDDFGTRVHLNMCPFSTVARPTTGIQRTSVWGLRTRL